MQEHQLDQTYLGDFSGNAKSKHDSHATDLLGRNEKTFVQAKEVEVLSHIKAGPKMKLTPLTRDSFGGNRAQKYGI